jgi:hypothetical protein
VGSDRIGCRIVVAGIVKAEMIAEMIPDEVNAVTGCPSKAA